MGAALHIEHEDETPIPRERWLAAIAADPSLKHVPRQEARNPKTGQVIGISGDMSRWTPAPATNPLATFSYRAGTISVGYRREKEFLTKVLDLAAALGAVVRDDEGGLFTVADLPEG